MMMLMIVDFDRLAAAYAEELHAEGLSMHDRIAPASVLMDLARLAGVPTPSVAAEADHEHDWAPDAPIDLFNPACTVCGSLPF